MDALSTADALYLQRLLEKQTVRKGFGPPINITKTVRLSIVELMRNASIRLELDSAVLHTGVWLFDCLTAGSFDINPSALQPVAFACLFMAAKLMVTRTELQSYWTFCRAGGVEMMEQRDLLDAEFVILKNVDWDISVPSVVTFIEFYKTLPATYDTDYGIEVDDKNRILMDAYLEKCLWIILQDVNLCMIPPSLLALGSIKASRRLIGMLTFPEVLIDFSPHTYREIIIAFCKISVSPFAIMGFV